MHECSIHLISRLTRFVGCDIVLHLCSLHTVEPGCHGNHFPLVIAQISEAIVVTGLLGCTWLAKHPWVKVEDFVKDDRALKATLAGAI